MKRFKDIVASLTAATLVAGLALNFNACSEQAPVGPGDNSDVATTSLSKKGGNGNCQEQQIVFPILVSKVFRFQNGQNYYRGGDIEFPDGNKSKFQIEDGALTPPSNMEWGEPVTITMEVDYDATKNELHYAFGPHGCQFNPQAQIKLDYGTLGVNVPVLYYIDEDGNYIEQTPENIDINRKWLVIRIDHFSRYAIAWSR